MFIEKNENNLTYMKSPNIACAHAFTTRFGGVSGGIYSSLNLGQSLGDDIVNVKENYNILCNSIGISVDDLIRSKQVHGTDIRIVTENDRGKLFTNDLPAADGLITNKKTVALIIYTADCVPILLHDPVKSVICAVHAGWRGTAANIAGNAINKMKEFFDCVPDNIKAAIGPCISKCCFETDNDVSDALRNTLGISADSCIEVYNNKFRVDLKEANKILLSSVGVKDINISDECTCCLSSKYWSHRRSNTKRGSQASIITL